MFDPNAHIHESIEDGFILGACLIAGMEQAVNVQVVPTSVAIEESVDLAHDIYNRVFRKVPDRIREKSKEV